MLLIKQKSEIGRFHFLGAQPDVAFGTTTHAKDEQVFSELMIIGKYVIAINV